MRFTVELRKTTDGVEGHVINEGSAEPEPFASWLELLRILEPPPTGDVAED